MASTMSPTSRESESPKVATGTFSEHLNDTRARSILSSAPTFVASNFWPSESFTVIWSAFPATWLLVSTNTVSPSCLMMIPEPRPGRSYSLYVFPFFPLFSPPRPPPKKNSNGLKKLNGVVSWRTTSTTSSSTTEGSTFLVIPLKEKYTSPLLLGTTL